MRYFRYCRKSQEDEDRQALSLPSQLAELVRTYEGNPEIEIVATFEEARTARYPGRHIFNEMIRRIQKGEAEGIIAWHPDRLARNSVDGGQIIYMLDTGALKDLKFPTYTFENTPQGKFMLSIMFTNSKYYVDNLSQNVKRGNRNKIENGWLPHKAPCGYLNDKEAKTIIADPDRFALVQEMWKLMLTGAYTPRQIWEIARDQMGLRTVKRKRIGGNPLSLSAVYTLLVSPFYAGYIQYQGNLYPGKHPAMVTLSEFERVQELLGRPGRPRRKKHEFPFTGMIRCGECGLSVTAEHKKNRYGYEYTYYHCSKRRHDYRCKQPSISAEDLEKQILLFLGELEVSGKLHSWTMAHLEKERAKKRTLCKATHDSLSQALKSITSQMGNLTSLRLREMITDGEFQSTRTKLLQEQERLSQAQTGSKRADAWFEPAELLILFSNALVSRFIGGDNATKRLILEIVGSNLVLMDKKFKIEAKKPFMFSTNSRQNSSLCTTLKEVRTLIETGDSEMQGIITGIRKVLNTP
jgi:DNA invertase Pin-like site-specific DNA recombinase